MEESKKKLDRDIENKKNEFNNEIEKELIEVEKEIKNLRKNSLSSVSKIASETSAEIVKQIIDTEVNKSNVSAIVSDLLKRKMEKQI